MIETTHSELLSAAKVVALLFLVACMTSAAPPPPDSAPAPSAEVDPGASLALSCGYRRICFASGDDPCCALAVSSPDAFRQQCGTAGACSDYVCPLVTGGALMFEVCK